MFSDWFRRRRRQALLLQPFPDAWRAILEQDVPWCLALSDAEFTKLCDDLRVIIAEKTWEGCGGQEITDRVKVVIAAQAALLILGLEPREHRYFPTTRTILVYPKAYYDPRPEEGFDGVYDETSWREGEAWYRGPVVLSWRDALRGAHHADDGRNLVLHEFAHQIDMQDDVLDGTPPLRSREDYRDWQRIMTAEFQRLIEASERGRATLLDDYGATDEAEFFAVATECFFERGLAMHARHPELYALLQRFYRQDPAARS